jgi:polysaccharide export outer membrane protein
MTKTLIILVVSLSCISPAARADDQLRQRPRYTLHTGDALSLDYRFTPEFNQTVTVQPDGYVDLAIVGNIKVGGLTVNEVHDRIVSLASSRLNNPDLTITLKEFEHPYVVVAGEVEKPGKFELQENTTALQAVMLAGGFKDSAKDTKVILFRRVNGDMAEVRQLNLHNINKTSDLEHDSELEPGDMLLITRNKMEHMSRFMKASNLGVYFNPFPVVP